MIKYYELKFHEYSTMHFNPIPSYENDRLSKLLYLTSKAEPAVNRIKEIHQDFYRTLCSDISPQDIFLCEQTLEKMMENINKKVWHRMEEHHG